MSLRLELYDGDVEIFDFLRSLETERALGVRARDGLPEGKADRAKAVPGRKMHKRKSNCDTL